MFYFIDLFYTHNIPFCVSFKMISYNIYFICIYPSGIVTKLLKSKVKLFTLIAHWQLTNICCTNWTAQNFHVVYLNFPRAPATGSAYDAKPLLIIKYIFIGLSNSVLLCYFTVLVWNQSPFKHLRIIILRTMLVWRISITTRIQSHKKKFFKTHFNEIRNKFYDEDLKFFQRSGKNDFMRQRCVCSNVFSLKKSNTCYQ